MYTFLLLQLFFFDLKDCYSMEASRGFFAFQLSAYLLVQSPSYLLPCGTCWPLPLIRTEHTVKSAWALWTEQRWWISEWCHLSGETCSFDWERTYPHFPCKYLLNDACSIHLPGLAHSWLSGCNPTESKFCGLALTFMRASWCFCGFLSVFGNWLLKSLNMNFGVWPEFKCKLASVLAV